MWFILFLDILTGCLYRVFTGLGQNMANPVKKPPMVGVDVFGRTLPPLPPRMTSSESTDSNGLPPPTLKKFATRRTLKVWVTFTILNLYDMKDEGNTSNKEFMQNFGEVLLLVT